MQDIFVLGTTKYSFMIHSFIEQEKQYRIVGHTVSTAYLEKAKAECASKNVKLFPLEHLHDYVSATKTVYILNTLGYSNMNRTREKMSKQCEKFGYKQINYVSNRAIVLSQIVGNGNIVFPNAYIGTDVVIGNNNVFYTGSIMTHDIIIGDNNFIAANVTVGGKVKIGNNCFIGMGATLRNRLSVSNYCLIGAASYLDHNTCECEVVVPAKSITLEKNSFEVNLIPKE